MRTGLDYVWDVLLTTLALAAGLPTLLFCINVFLSGASLGFDTFDEKSVVATTAQERDLFGNEYMNNKAFLTLAHMVMMPAIDDAREGGRTLIGPGVVYAYSPGTAARLDKSRVIEDTATGMGVNRTSDFEAVHHLSIDESGTVALSTNRVEVD